ncbi:MAG: hypothetical protein GY832_03610 [Chloroflexi bacterium]|nr:hypothetical protein [Chloroflexota bacterium]
MGRLLPRLGTSLLLMLSLGWVVPVSAQTSNGTVKMAVTPYLGGHVKYGEWLPLRVELENEGEDLTAQVQAYFLDYDSKPVHAVSVSLPAGAHKEIDIYVLPPLFADKVTVHLVQGADTVAQASTPLWSHPQLDYLIGVVAPDMAAFGPLNGIRILNRGQAYLVPISLDDLPKRVEPLRTLDCLILTGVDTTSLDSAQGEALHTWVELGGRLVIGGGAAAHRVMAGLPDAVQPTGLGETVELAVLDSLAEFAGIPVQVSGPFLATFPVEYSNRPLIIQDGRPLVVQSALGKGWVGYLSLDPSTNPFDAWAGTLDFWQKLVSPGSALPADTPYDVSVRELEFAQMNYALSNLPALDLPSIRSLGLVLGLYILLVGPVNYVFLRRLRRLAWGWITIPALTCIFSIGGYGLGYQLRGSDVVINQITILPVSSTGSRLPARSYIGLFSPTSQDYDIEVGGDALISRLSSHPDQGGIWPGVYDSMNVLQGERALVRGMSVSQWTMQGFRAETRPELDDLAVDATLAIEGDQVTGSIRNGLGRSLSEMVLVFGRRYVHLGDLASDEVKEIEATLRGEEIGFYFPYGIFDLMSHAPEAFDPSRKESLWRSILEAYFHTNWGSPTPFVEPTLLAWTDLNILDVQVVGIKAAIQPTTLVIAPLSLSIVGGQVSFPPGLLSGLLTEVEGDAWECGASNNEFYVGQGRAVIDYRLPSMQHVFNPTALTIDISGGYQGSVLPEISFYDWEVGDWETLANVESHRLYALGAPGRFVDPAFGLIRLQLEGDADGDCYYYKVGLDGELLSVGESR